MDTVGSACALAAILGRNARPCGVHVSRSARRVIDATGFSFVKLDSKRPLWPKTLAGIVVVDSAGPGQTGLHLPKVPLCVIDHHASTSDAWNSGEGDLILVGRASSTAQIIADWIIEFHRKTLSRDIASLLLAGIITDTGRFSHGDSEALRISSLLVHDDEHLNEILSLLDSAQPDRSTRISMLKSLSRVTTKDAGRWLVAISDARSHEGQIASALIATGADISLVSNRLEDDVRLTCRVSRTAISEGMDVGKVMVELARKLGGEGGGHAGAAGATTAVDSVEAISVVLSLISAVRRD
jgi:nanoRNase/pAp phosphatase (c-di-AMP/oligoRNAs hydrolase)